jgi:hypothetical protein
VQPNIWVIDYRRQSSFQALAERQVVACGELYEPDPLSPHIVGWMATPQSDLTLVWVS